MTDCFFQFKRAILLSFLLIGSLSLQISFAEVKLSADQNIDSQSPTRTGGIGGTGHQTTRTGGIGGTGKNPQLPDLGNIPQIPEIPEVPELPIDSIPDVPIFTVPDIPMLPMPVDHLQ